MEVGLADLLLPHNHDCSDMQCQVNQTGMHHCVCSKADLCRSWDSPPSSLAVLSLTIIINWGQNYSYRRATSEGDDELSVLLVPVGDALLVEVFLNGRLDLGSFLAAVVARSGDDGQLLEVCVLVGIISFFVHHSQEGAEGSTLVLRSDGFETFLKQLQRELDLLTMQIDGLNTFVLVTERRALDALQPEWGSVHIRYTLAKTSLAACSCAASILAPSALAFSALFMELVKHHSQSKPVQKRTPELTSFVLVTLFISLISFLVVFVAKLSVLVDLLLSRLVRLLWMKIWG